MIYLTLAQNNFINKKKQSKICTFKGLWRQHKIYAKSAAYIKG